MIWYCKKTETYHFLILLLGIAILSFPSKIWAKPSENYPTYFMLRYQNSKTEVFHNENSSAPGFFSAEETSDIRMHGVFLEAAQEFGGAYLFSLTIGARLGYTQGSDKTANANESIVKYEDKISGFSYGPGGSLNLNFHEWGLKIQPFISSYYIFSKSELRLTYANATFEAQPFLIDYDIEENRFQHSVGIRFIDKESGLMSYFSVDYIQEASRDIIVSNKQDGSLTVTNLAEIEGPQISLSGGIGYSF